MRDGALRVTEGVESMIGAEESVMGGELCGADPREVLRYEGPRMRRRPCKKTRSDKRVGM